MNSDRNHQETRLTLLYAVLLGVLTVGSNVHSND